MVTFGQLSFVFRHPRYFLVSSLVILVIIILAVLGPKLLTSIIWTGGLTEIKLSSFGLFYLIYVFSVVGPILLYFSLIGKGKLSRIIEPVQADLLREKMFSVIGKVLTIIFIILFLFVSTTVISVDSQKVTHYLFLTKNSEIQLDSITEITADYFQGGQINMYLIQNNGVKELFFATGAGYDKTPYTEAHTKAILSNLNQRIKQIKVINYYTHVDNNAAKGVVQNYLTSFGANFEINVQKAW